MNPTVSLLPALYQLLHQLSPYLLAGTIKGEQRAALERKEGMLRLKRRRGKKG